jgi:rfaE bifunctional protein kinase chain/domain
MSGQSIHSIFEGFKGLKVLVLGDVMVDAYIWGSANRISPEAPVPVVKTTGREFRLGGAANVALNVHALEAEPILCGIIGEDFEGGQFLERLKIRNIDSSCIVRSRSRPTTVKTRVLSGYQHIVRIDSEDEFPLNKDEENAMLSKALDKLEEVDVVIFEDYDKGALTNSLISKIIEKANSLNIPTVVDPKRQNFLNYRGATVFKPNLKELHDGLKLDHELTTIPEISKALEQLQEKIDVKEVFLTLSEKGVLIKNKETEIHIPAHVRTISDVSGAGDTVISIIALCKAMDLSASFMAKLANLGGGIVCEHVGVVPVDKDKLLEEADNYDIVKHL